MALKYQSLLEQLKIALNDLQFRCSQLDKTTKQTENHYFAFDVHIFHKQSLSLQGYFEQVEKTYFSLSETIEKKMSEDVIKHESELLVSQFQLLLQLVNGLEKGDATVLYQSYSPVKEKIYQHLKKQYQYEKRLITMIGEQEELLKAQFGEQLIYAKERLEALKVRFQKCNTFTQKLEFQLESLEDE